MIRMLQRRKTMTDSAQPFAAKKFLQINGRRMAYIDEGDGAPIVFAHGNPTSSYLWRNVMPACRGLGRLIACDMIGMGDSAKLPDSGPDRYTYAEQRNFLFALWKAGGRSGRCVGAARCGFPLRLRLDAPAPRARPGYRLHGGACLPGAILRRLSEDEMAAYRAPFANAGKDRRPTLTWLRQIPIEGDARGSPSGH